MTGTPPNGCRPDTARGLRSGLIQVKLEYGLSIDPAERDALEALLAGGGAQLNCVDADELAPTMLTLSADPAPAEGGNPVTVTATLDNPAPANGMTVTLTTGGTAMLDTDYTLSSTTLTLAEGETGGHGDAHGHRRRRGRRRRDHRH